MFSSHPLNYLDHVPSDNFHACNVWLGNWASVVESMNNCHSICHKIKRTKMFNYPITKSHGGMFVQNKISNKGFSVSKTVLWV